MGYGFGIVGIGMISDFHAKAISALDNAELVACYSRTQEKAEDFAKQYGGKGYSSMDDFLHHNGLDIVTICTPSGLHMGPSIQAIEAGKHVIIEKPLEITLERCDTIIETAQREGVKIAGIFPSRFHDVPGLVKKAISDGRFGRLTLGDAYVKWYRTQEYYDNGEWRGTWKLDGGGALMNQSIHAIDLLQWYMGPVEYVQSITATLAHERIEVEDTAVSVIRFKNGALGVIEGTTSVYPGFLKKIEISGDQGSIVMEEEDLKTWSFKHELPEDYTVRDEYLSKTETGGGATDPSAIGFHGHQRQFEDFIKALDEGREPLVNGVEARKAVEIIIAIYKSTKRGERVEI